MEASRKKKRKVLQHFAAFWGHVSLWLRHHDQDEKTNANFIKSYIDSIESDSEERVVIRLHFREDRQDLSTRRQCRRLKGMLASKTFTPEQRFIKVQADLDERISDLLR